MGEVRGGRNFPQLSTRGIIALLGLRKDQDGLKCLGFFCKLLISLGPTVFSHGGDRGSKPLGTACNIKGLYSDITYSSTGLLTNRRLWESRSAFSQATGWTEPLPPQGGHEICRWGINDGHAHSEEWLQVWANRK